MALWLALENSEGDTVHLNMELAVSIRRLSDGLTRITFPSPQEQRLTFVVKDEPESILHQIANRAAGPLKAAPKSRRGA
ncbi:MAG: hypothetical protein JOY77_11970 [Alphaproteobacteria bacterium]|nr:hypothetical protein [Alphaproteobacteria bacterium]MBV9063627.1 hypothetical protein [Alphaproteobacteria bacterium]